jgi:hypothetical protein
VLYRFLPLAIAWLFLGSCSALLAEEAAQTNVNEREEAASPDNAQPKKKSSRHAKLISSEENILKKRIPSQPEKHIIGATALVVESQSELPFQARIDTGAASCSIHCEGWEIDDEADSMESNVGKPIRVLICNYEDKPTWIESEIDHCVTVKTSEKHEVRYKVPLTFRWKEVEKEVVVTLNNREEMNYPLLLGRNFLSGDFVVDIDHAQNDGEVTAESE